MGRQGGNIPGNSPRHSELATPVAAWEMLEQRHLLSASVHDGCWKIVGDGEQGNRNDTITIQHDGDDATQLQAVINGHVVDTQPVDSISRIVVLAGRGDDTVVIDLAGEENISTIVNGGSGDDTITGGDGADRLFGGSGNDTINGGAGDDRVYGSNGSDTLSGGDGDDRLYGGNGTDILNGDAGNDTLYGGNASDTLAGGDGDDLMYGGNGTDSLDGGAGNDVLYGGRGSDELTGGDGDDELWGGHGRDTLRGGAGADVLTGGQSPDIIYSVEGEDEVQGDRRDTIRNDLEIEAIGGDEVLPLADAPLSDGARALRDAAIDAAVQQYAELLGQPYVEPPRYWDFGNVGTGGIVLTTTNFTSAVTNSSTGDYSTTNIQEQGVDEGDLVETDGQYIYMISGGGLSIVKAWPADQLEVVSTTKIGGYAAAMYLNGDLLTVISTSFTWYSAPVRYLAYSRVESSVTTTVYDVSDPSSPQRVDRTRLNGSYVTSRMVGDTLYLVTSQSLQPCAPRLILASDGSTSIYETEEAYRQRLVDSAATWMPIATVAAQDDQVETVDLLGMSTARVYQPERFRDGGVISVTAFDLGDDKQGPTASTNLPGTAAQAYATEDNLYIAIASTAYSPLFSVGTGPYTDLYKLNLTAQDIPLVASGRVAGQMNSSYCMDEADGILRLATNDSSGTSVTTLAQSGDRLEVLGSVGGIEPGEQIKGVQFIGDKAYVVTYRIVDPLFVIDLADPASPTILGELTMFGYSAYLHPLDANHLIGWGPNDTDTGWMSGIQVSLFDVTDPTDPLRQDYYTMDGRAWSEDLTNTFCDPHAFAYYADYQTVTIPFFDTLAVLKVTDDGGVDFVGSLANTGSVRRSVRIGEYLYAVSAGRITSALIDQPGEMIGSVDVPVIEAQKPSTPWWPMPIWPVRSIVFPFTPISITTPVLRSPTSGLVGFSIDVTGQAG